MKELPKNCSSVKLGQQSKEGKRVEKVSAAFLKANSVVPKFDVKKVAGFQQDFSLAIRTKEDLLRMIQRQGDADFLARLQEMFIAYTLPDAPPIPPPPGSDGLED